MAHVHVRARLSVCTTANESVFVDCCTTQLGQMPLPKSRSWAVRLMCIVYGFFSLIIIASYTANLAAFLTVRFRVQDFAQ
jgi:Ligand-gated ion channel